MTSEDELVIASESRPQEHPFIVMAFEFEFYTEDTNASITIIFSIKNGDDIEFNIKLVSIH